MKLDMPFALIDWTRVPVTTHSGETGEASWQTVQAGSTRVRVVEYPAGYRADHWCLKGHVVYVLGGEFTTVHQNGSSHQLRVGMMYVMGDDIEPHLSFTESGVRLLIVD